MVLSEINVIMVVAEVPVSEFDLLRKAVKELREFIRFDKVRELAGNKSA